MKRTEKLFSTLLMIVMFVTSVGLLYASIYASGGGSQSTFGSVVFEKETGIRYNNLTKEFEVFNEAGVSWIGSGRYISVEGVVAPSETPTNPDTYAQADSNQTYNIMRDIAYSGTISGDNIYNTNFDTNKITLGSTGILDGRGFTLKGFKFATITLEGKSVGTALVATNNGTIRNLNMSNASLASASVGDAAGIICGINKGIIDSCITYGTDSNATYETDLYTELYGICAISSGKITNSVNNANLNNTKADSVSAGITGVVASASLLNNTNNGNIAATAHAAGIAIDAGGVVFTVRGNTNNGNLTAETSVSGIIDGGQALTNMVEKNNTNNGELDCDEIYELYYGVADAPPTPTYGIRYSTTLTDSTDTTRSGFEIFNADGITWVSSGVSFNEDGDKGTGTTASTTAFYKIADGVSLIDYNEKTTNYNSAFETTVPSIGSGGEFDGNGCTLTGFKLRQCGTSGTAESYYSTLFYENKGTIRNFTMQIYGSDATITGLTGTKYAGGIVGSNLGLLDSLHMKGTIKFECDYDYVSAYSFVGGILGGAVRTGSGNSIVRNCTVVGNVEGVAYVGGVVGGGGSINYNPITLSNCVFSGVVRALNGEGKNSYGGGLVGDGISPFTFEGCSVSGDIWGKYTGNIFGFYNPQTTYQVNLLSTGTVHGISYDANKMIGAFSNAQAP